MTRAEWYYVKEGKEVGPISGSELKELAYSGFLAPEDLVRREEMRKPTRARNVKGLFPESSQQPPDIAPPEEPSPVEGPPQSDTVPWSDRGEEGEGPSIDVTSSRVWERYRKEQDTDHLFDVLLNSVRTAFDVRFIAGIEWFFTLCGHYGLYLAMALCLLCGLVRGMKTDSLQEILFGLGAALAIALLQYAARRFLAALARLNETTRGSVVSWAFPDCFALGMLLAGIFALLAVTIIALRIEEPILILAALAAFVECEYAAILALHPAKVLNITLARGASAAEEAIGIFTFFLKIAVRLVPIAFGVGVIVGTLQLLYGCGLVLRGTTSATSDLAQAKAGIDATGGEAVALVVGGTIRTVSSACVPLLAYLMFLFCYLFAGVMRAMLVIPGKLDTLAAALTGRTPPRVPPPPLGPTERQA